MQIELLGKMIHFTAASALLSLLFIFVYGCYKQVQAENRANRSNDE